MTSPSPEILPLGLDGILVRFADTLSEAANRAALAFRAEVEHDLPAGVTETATSLTSVLIRFRPGDTARARLEDDLRQRLARQDWYHAPLPEGRTLWRIPAVFGGEYGPQLMWSEETKEQPYSLVSHFKDDAYIKPGTGGFMINLRVDDCDGMVAQLKAKGVAILDSADEGYGKFAWLLDPNGVKIELWEQVAEELP